ncbi:MAG TPA: GDSL-type esterase/lipase family protein, partial [Hyphomicrobiaceae bacterium]|nr:GDSL-type esterase/lipase family protein [Hyphomicrobiaceae bacterium]
MRMRGLCVGLLAAVVAAGSVMPAAAQTESYGSSYLPPFPQNDTYRLQVIGDSLAEGLLEGMLQAFAGENRLQIQRRVRSLSGLTRPEAEETLRTFEESLATDSMHIAVVMLGAYDRTPMRLANGRRVSIESEEWRSEYARRIDRAMRALKRRNVAVYWVSLPILRRPEWSADASEINEIIRERAGANGIRFIDIFNETADETGNYSAYGADLAGKNRLLREADGVHFTSTGNRKLAFYVERELKRDLTHASNERATPLAGSESEQRRLVPAAAAAPGEVGKGAGENKAPRQAGSAPRSGEPGSSTRADNTKVSFKVPGASGREEQVTVEIVRPAIPASVIALVTRRESADRATPIGETVTQTLANGIMVMDSLTLTATPGLKGQRPPPTQMPFFRVLVKGERQTPRPGRADDFRWPREDEAAPPPP